MKISALPLPKFRRKSLFFYLIILFTFLLFLLPKESFAGSVYFDVTPPSGANYSTVPTDQAASLCGEPLECANSQNPGNCSLPTCPTGGLSWTKYELTCVYVFSKLDYDSYYQQNGRVCSIGDKYNSSNPPIMNAGNCDCSVGGLYKTCCSGTTPVSARDLCSVGSPLCDNNSPPEADCGGYTEVKCGPGYPTACGAPACQTNCAQTPGSYAGSICTCNWLTIERYRCDGTTFSVDYPNSDCNYLCPTSN